MKEEVIKKKREIRQMGGQNSAPTLKFQLSCWVNLVKLSLLSQLPKKKFPYFILFSSSKKSKINSKKKKRKIFLERIKYKRFKFKV